MLLLLQLFERRTSTRLSLGAGCARSDNVCSCASRPTGRAFSLCARARLLSWPAATHTHNSASRQQQQQRQRNGAAAAAAENVSDAPTRASFRFAIRTQRSTALASSPSPSRQFCLARIECLRASAAMRARELLRARLLIACATTAAAAAARQQRHSSLSCQQQQQNEVARARSQTMGSK